MAPKNQVEIRKKPIIGVIPDRSRSDDPVNIRANA